MRYDCILFDLDGTLIRSEQGITHSARYALEKMGRAVPSEETLKQFIGPPLKHSFMTIGGMSAEEAVRATEFYRERYREVGWSENEVYEGIPALLKALRRAGVKLGVATAKPQVFTEQILQLFGLRPYFDTVCGIRMDDHSPDKKQLIAAATPEGCTRVCMVGDRKFDIEAARALGCGAVGVLYGYGSREELAQAGATQIVETPEELTQLLLEDLPREQGLFLSFEGSDGCGKSTQMKILAQWLKTCGWRVKTTREPGGGPVSEAIRALVLDPAQSGMTPMCEAYLFAASRAQHVRDTIRPALERGEVVLCDRFLDSSVAFQGAGRGMGVKTVLEINRHAVEGTMPDATFLLTIDPHVAMQRRLSASSPDRIEQEKQEFVERVYAAFDAIAQAEPQRVRRIDANGGVEQVQSLVRQAALELLSKIS